MELTKYPLTSYKSDRRYEPSLSGQAQNTQAKAAPGRAPLFKRVRGLSAHVPDIIIQNPSVCHVPGRQFAAAADKEP
jgi:hypothetical protein